MREKHPACADSASPFISDIQAPGALGMSPRAFREAVKRGGIPHRKLGARVIVFLTDLAPEAEPVPEPAVAPPTASELAERLGFKRSA